MNFSCPHCRQSMEGPADMLGQLFDCPNCGNTIELRPAHSFSATAEIHSPRTKADVVQTNVKQGAVIGSALCLVFGLLLMSFSLLWFFIYGPLFFAAFVLGIVAMAQKRIWSGLLALLATCIIPGALFFFLSVNRAAEAVVAIDAAMENNRAEMDQAMQMVAKDMRESQERTAREFEENMARAFEEADAEIRRSSSE